MYRFSVFFFNFEENDTQFLFKFGTFLFIFFKKDLIKEMCLHFLPLILSVGQVTLTKQPCFLGLTGYRGFQVELPKATGIDLATLLYLIRSS